MVMANYPHHIAYIHHRAMGEPVRIAKKLPIGEDRKQSTASLPVLHRPGSVNASTITVALRYA
jgi:hypothetical protein